MLTNTVVREGILRLSLLLCLNLEQINEPVTERLCSKCHSPDRKMKRWPESRLPWPEREGRRTPARSDCSGKREARSKFAGSQGAACFRCQGQSLPATEKMKLQSRPPFPRPTNRKRKQQDWTERTRAVKQKARRAPSIKATRCSTSCQAKEYRACCGALQASRNVQLKVWQPVQNSHDHLLSDKRRIFFVNSTRSGTVPLARFCTTPPHHPRTDSNKCSLLAGNTKPPAWERCTGETLFQVIKCTALM